MEWTAEMIIGYLVLADDYEEAGDQQKAQEYRGKAEKYTKELDKLKDADGDLPYSTAPDTFIVAEWGWKTPTGTKSLSATAYYQLALLGDNPLTTEIEHLWE